MKINFHLKKYRQKDSLKANTLSLNKNLYSNYDDVDDDLFISIQYITIKNIIHIYSITFESMRAREQEREKRIILFNMFSPNFFLLHNRVTTTTLAILYARFTF